MNWSDQKISLGALLPPTEELDKLWNMGLAGAPLVQYLKWAEELRIFHLLAKHGAMTLTDVAAETSLTARGADALLGVLSGLQVTRHDDGKYYLSELAQEYLVEGSDYYVGPSLYGMLKAKFPPRLQKGEKIKYFSKSTGTLRHKLSYLINNREMGRPERLAVQHSRNYPAAVVAVNKGLFNDLHHVLDVGGGSGAFAIPLVRSRADMFVTLMELPQALPHIREFLQGQGGCERIRLLGLNMHKLPWPDIACDGVLLGNILHFLSDDESRVLLSEAFNTLPAGGKIFIHEMLWNENREGPLATALWNFWMTSVSAGRQRTLWEIVLLLKAVGFAQYGVEKTWGSFSMITSMKK